MPASVVTRLKAPVAFRWIKATCATLSETHYNAVVRNDRAGGCIGCGGGDTLKQDRCISSHAGQAGGLWGPRSR